MTEKNLTEKINNGSSDSNTAANSFDSAAASNPDMMKCPVCGQYVAKTAAICPHCGAKLSRGKGGLFWAVIIIGVLIIAAIIGGFAYHEHNVKVRHMRQSVQTIATNAANRQANDIITVDLNELCREYKANTTAADQKYKSKLIQTTGKIKDIKSDADKFYVTLDTGDLLNAKFSFDKSLQNEISKLNDGQLITLQGRVDGYSITITGLGVNDCKIVKVQ